MHAMNSYFMVYNFVKIHKSINRGRFLSAIEPFFSLGCTALYGQVLALLCPYWRTAQDALG